MVHALEEIYRLLKPDGYLIEIHPISEIPLVKVVDAKKVLLSGPYPGYEYEEDLRQAENAIQEIIQRGLFSIAGSTEFVFMTYGSSIAELLDFWEEPAEARGSPLYKQIEEQMNIAGNLATVALQEKVRLIRLEPVADVR